MAQPTPVKKRGAATLEVLTQTLTDENTSRKIDNEPGTYMPLIVERLTDCVFSLSHYFEQNGDLVPDPDMSFYRREDGTWFAIDCTLAIGHYTQALGIAGGEIESFAPRASRELASFANMWLKNIRWQQGINPPAAPKAERPEASSL